MPLSDEAPCPDPQIMSGALPPNTIVSSAMIAKVGAAASDSQSVTSVVVIIYSSEGFFAGPPGRPASTVTTASAHSTTAERNAGERIVQSTMTLAFSLRRTGLS